MNQGRLLIVEDDDNLRETLADFLELEQFTVAVSENVAEAKNHLISCEYDLVILDIMLPDGDGYQLAQWIREQNIATRIIMLTARQMEKDVVEGFESGADDYVTKPYRTQEMLARIKAILRRPLSLRTSVSETEINGFTVDWKGMSIRQGDQSLHLTQKAFGILSYLFQRVGDVVSREDILNEVWGKDVYVDQRTIDNFISTLKKQLDLNKGNPYFVKSIRGVGYSLIHTSEKQ